MSATRLELAWDVRNESGNLNVGFRPAETSRLVRQIAPARESQRCPECKSIIYSRRHKLCSVCAEPLPEQLLFSTTEAERVEQLLRNEQSRHRKWMGAR
ncbi:MAG: hypothetical protein U1G07_11735 [Verrucomicrobiota bacterium]